MEVELNFARCHASYAFDKAVWLVIFLAAVNNLFEFHSVGHGERRLINDLVTGIEFWHDKVTGRAVR
jgi:hypothetical protein